MNLIGESYISMSNEYNIKFINFDASELPFSREINNCWYKVYNFWQPEIKLVPLKKNNI